jgi:hypothetical protein
MKQIVSIWGLFIVMGLILSSCTKMKENKLERTWQLIDIGMELPENVIELWDFKFGKYNRLRLRTDTILPNDTIDSGWYLVKSGLSNTTVTISGCANPVFNANWEVKKLKQDIMILLNTRDNNFLYKEFEKYP